MLQYLDKVQFVDNGDVRLGVVLEVDGQPMIYSIDDTEQTVTSPPDKVSKIEVVGKVTPLNRIGLSNSIGKLIDKMDDEALGEWIAQCPGVSCTALTPTGFIFLTEEKPLTYTFIGSFAINGVNRDVSRGSDGKMYAVNSHTKERVELTKEDLFSFFEHAQ